MTTDKIGEYTLLVMKKASWYNDWLFSHIQKNLTKGKILEIGAGIGNFTGKISSLGELTSIDISLDYVRNLRKKFGDEANIGYGNIENGKFFFRNRKFDSIVCLNVLEHIKYDKKALIYMNKLLKKNGRLILLVPAHNYLFSGYDKALGHFRRYGTRNLNELLVSSGFKDFRLRYMNWWAAIGWFVFFKLVKKPKMPELEVSIFNYLGKLFLWPEKYLSPPFGLSLFVVAKK